MSHSFHWPMNEVFTARRLELVDPRRSRLYTTAASLLNAALFGPDHAQGGTNEPGHTRSGPSPRLNEGAIVYRHRTAIALYYLAIDEANRTRRREVEHRPPPHDGLPQHDHEDTPYQRHLKREYPLLFDSGLLQEMLLTSSLDKSFVVEVFGGSDIIHGRTTRVSQELGNSNVVGGRSISIKYHAEPFPYASRSCSLSAHTTELSVSLSTARPPTSAFHPAPRSPIAGSLKFKVVVPCFPLLVIDEAHSLTRLLQSLETSSSRHDHPSRAETVERFLEHGRARRNSVNGPVEIQELVVRFSNLSLLVRLAPLVVQSFLLPRHQDADVDSMGLVWSRYASQFLVNDDEGGGAQQQRNMVVETLTELERFDESLAVVVAREFVKWPRWIRTTTEFDHHGVWVSDQAIEVFNEWKVLVGWFKVLVGRESIAIQDARSR